MTHPSQLSWHEVTGRFAPARNWWVATTGEAGPHAVPVWGVVWREALWFYGSPHTVRTRNLLARPEVVLNLENGEDPLIVHGRAVPRGLARERVELVEAYASKYREEHDADYLLDTAYAADALAFEVTPSKALAWRVSALEDWTIRRWRP